jgi:putative transcriptional regulator
MSKLFDDLKQGIGEMAAHIRGEDVPGITLNSVTIKPVPEHQPGDIKRIRSKLGASQGALAAILGVTKKSVEAWEAGTNIPTKPVMRLLQLISLHNELIHELVEKTAIKTTKRRA